MTGVQTCALPIYCVRKAADSGSPLEKEQKLQEIEKVIDKLAK